MATTWWAPRGALALLAILCLAACSTADAANLKTIDYCAKYPEGAASRMFCDKYLGAKKPLEQFCVARNWLVSVLEGVVGGKRVIMYMSSSALAARWSCSCCASPLSLPPSLLSTPHFAPHPRRPRVPPQKKRNRAATSPLVSFFSCSCSPNDQCCVVCASACAPLPTSPTPRRPL